MDSGGRTDTSDDGPPRADGSGHRVPEGQAPEEYGNHRGHGGDGDEHDHRSRWPLVAAAGAAGLYSGVAISILGNEIGLVPPLIGIGLAVVGAIVLLAGIAGWVEQAFLAPARDAQGTLKSRESYVSTTLLFLATDVSTFGALFIYYFFVRIGSWPPETLPPLLGSLVVVNTAILIASSVTFHYAHKALGGRQPTTIHRAARNDARTRPRLPRRADLRVLRVRGSRGIFARKWHLRERVLRTDRAPRPPRHAGRRWHCRALLAGASGPLRPESGHVRRDRLAVLALRRRRLDLPRRRPLRRRVDVTGLVVRLVSPIRCRRGHGISS